MTICQVCQKENPAGAEYCEDCGAALSAPAPTPVGAGVSGGGSAAASATGTGPTASAAGSVGSLAPEGPATASDASAPPAADAVPDRAAHVVVKLGGSLAGAPAETESSGASAPPRRQRHPRRARRPRPGRRPRRGSSRCATARRPATRSRCSASAWWSGASIRRPGRSTSTCPRLPSPATSRGSTASCTARATAPGWCATSARRTASSSRAATDASFGPRITAPRALKDGDEVAFGNARFIFKTT